MSNQLKTYLKAAKAAYYSGNPIISDSQYDHLEDLLAEQEQTIGTEEGRYKHWYKMYSLKKYYVGEKLPDDGQYFVTPKLDGSAVALYYVDGVLSKVVTRGDGEFGEDITHLFRRTTALGIPLDFSTDRRFTAQITGEIVAPKAIPNARNYAAGALGLKSEDEFYEKDLQFFAYNIKNTLYKSYFSNLKYLDALGFKTVMHKDTELYPQDGQVYRLDSILKFEELGYTSKHPRGAFALKERTEGIKTTLLDVIWQTGKSGKVTPVAILDPIDIDGAVVQRATLNNPGFIEALDLEIGDEVMVERAGGIIPRIICKAPSNDQEKNSS